MADSEGVAVASPNVPSSRDRDADPAEMAADYLVQLGFELYARSCNLDCSEELHNRAQALKAEVLRRVEAASGGVTLKFDVELAVSDRQAADIFVRGLSSPDGRRAFVSTAKREKRNGNI